MYLWIIIVATTFTTIDIKDVFYITLPEITVFCALIWHITKVGAIHESPQPSDK